MIDCGGEAFRPPRFFVERNIRNLKRSYPSFLVLTSRVRPNCDVAERQTLTTTVLELAISLAFFFLLVSALCSALQELIASWLNLRATTMEDAFKKLLDDSNATKLYDHVLVKGMWKDGRKPSYLTPETFSRVLLDLDKGGLSGTAKQIVDTLAPTALTDIEAHRAAIEKWFDDAMGRVSGWYKRKTHVLVWAIAVPVCLFLNADVFMLGKLFWNDEAVRGSMVAAATEYVKDNSGKNEQAKTNSGTGQPGAAAQNKGQTPPGSSPGSGTDANGAGHSASGGTKNDAAGATGDGVSNKGSSSEDALEKVKKIRGALAGTGAPIGWCWLPEGATDPKEVQCWPKVTSPPKADVVDEKKQAQTAPAVGGESGKQAGAQNEGKTADKAGTSNKLEGAKQELAQDGSKPPNQGSQPKKKELTAEEKAKIRAEAEVREPRLAPIECGGWIIKFLGILMTALAVSQGSPFWFDLLSKATNVRLAGTKPDGKK